MNMLGMGMFGKDPITTTCPNCQANVSNLILTRWSILGSDGMTKSDCSLSLWLLSECPLSIHWVPSEWSLNACLMLSESSWSHPVLKTSWRHPEDILKSSWSHPEVILKSSWSHPEVIMKSSWCDHEVWLKIRWRLSALEHFVPDGQTDRHTDRQSDTLGSCRSQKYHMSFTPNLMKIISKTLHIYLVTHRTITKSFIYICPWLHRLWGFEP